MEPIRTDPGREAIQWIKGVVELNAYEPVEVASGKVFFMGKTLSQEERAAYTEFLGGFLDVFA